MPHALDGVAGGHGPKRYRGLIGRYAAGLKVSVDQRMADAVFLHTHPGWTYRDLMETPSDIVMLMRLIYDAEAKVKQARMQQGERSG